ncbi:MAG: serine hydrolase [Parvularculaceae bacterium]
MTTRKLIVTIIAMIAASLAGAAARSDEGSGDGPRNGVEFDRTLSKIVKGKGPTDPIAAAAVAVMVGDRLVYSGAAGCAEFDAEGTACVRAFEPTSKLRVASISKMALSMGLMSLVEQGRLDLDRDVSDYLGWRLRNPAFPDRPITARQLLSHTSSIRDPETYWVAAPGAFQDLFDDGAAPFDDAHAPGEWFRYANLNFGILAGVIERAGSERFDLFMSNAAFKPMGLDVGYNWSGVSQTARRKGAGLYSREGDAWAPVVDAPKILADNASVFLAEEGLDRESYLTGYELGDNPTLFSPQGGLRASAVDLADLARALDGREMQIAPVWRYDADAPNGDTEDGYFDAFGLGVQTVEGNRRLLPGGRLIGHGGEAYGLYSGAWLIKGDRSAEDDEDVTIAYVATGVSKSPGKGAHPTFNRLEERLIRLGLHAADALAEPHPFDVQADAMSDVDAALSSARNSGKRVLLALGGNWCHDSRGLAKKFATKPLKQLIDTNFELVWVDVGQRDRNLDVARRFGVEKLLGTPTVLVLSPEGQLLNADTVFDWRTADSRSMDDAISYFSAFAADPE